METAGKAVAAAGQLRLYVNGEPRATAARLGLWHANGALTIGRAWYSGIGVPAAAGDWWPGAIDDVQVFAGVVPASEIGGLR